MSKRLILLALLFPLSRLAAQEDVGTRLSRAFSVIDSAVRVLPPGPGFVIGITDRDRVLRVFTHGYADVKLRTPVTQASPFAIGSMSKSFTAISLMQLADEGRFDPREPVTRYLPWFQVRSAYAPITGHHLLTHTAGLPNYRPDLASMAYAAHNLRDFEVSYAPGAHYWYSNIGYQTLGYVLEGIEDAPYRTVVERRIFAPLGMNSSLPLITDAARLKMPVSYQRTSCDTTWVEAPWFEYRAADGSIVSTVNDMLAYVRALLNRGATPRGRLLSERAFTTLTTPANANYAYGLRVRMVGDDTIIGHGGSIAGFRSSMNAHMRDGFAVVVLSNGGIAPGAWIESVVRAAIRGMPLPNAPASAIADDRRSAVTRFAGEYFSSSDGRITFAAGDDGLSMLSGGRTMRLRRQTASTFCSSDSEAGRFPFAFETRGDTIVAVSHGPEIFAASAYPRPARLDTPAEFLPLVGRYENHNPEESTLRVFVRGGKLYAARGPAAGMLLVGIAPNRFRYAAPDSNPERLQFDSMIGGQAWRLLLSGMPMYRIDDR